MQLAAPSANSPSQHSARSAVARHGVRARLEPIHDLHPQRRACEAFIAARFQRAYGARIEHFAPHLLGVRDGLAGWRAAAGYAPANGHRLFIEQYLDDPIERCVACRTVHPIARDRIVEVANLAAVSPGMARVMILLFARHLHRLGYQWVVFTATRQLRNAFSRLGLSPLVIAPADPARLVAGSTHWGSYYANDPVVMAGRISHGVRLALPA